MKAETIKSNSGPFGISLVPETDDDKEILKKFFYIGVKTTTYNTTNGHLVLEGPLNKRQTDTEPEPHISRRQVGYGEYIDYLLARGWDRQLITIDQNSEDFVTVSSVNKGNTCKIISIRCPSGKMMSIMGRKEALQGKDSNLEKDSNLAYPFGLYIVDKDGKEIPDDTKIRIVKDEPSVTIVQLERPSYSDIKMRNGEATHRLEKGVEFRGGEYIIISVINSQNDIHSENIQFKMKIDLWSRDT